MGLRMAGTKKGFNVLLAGRNAAVRRGKTMKFDKLEVTVREGGEFQSRSVEIAYYAGGQLGLDGCFGPIRIQCSKDWTMMKLGFSGIYITRSFKQDTAKIEKFISSFFKPGKPLSAALKVLSRMGATLKVKHLPRELEGLKPIKDVDQFFVEQKERDRETEEWIAKINASKAKRRERRQASKANRSGVIL